MHIVHFSLLSENRIPVVLRGMLMLQGVAVDYVN